MFNVASSLLLVALALNTEYAFGTNQHLICKPIDDVFSDVTASQAPMRPQGLQGPPGKRGQTGAKGEPGIPGLKGEEGIPGLVDPQNIANVVEKKMREVTRKLEGRIETLEEEVLEMNSTVQDFFSCNEEGLFYKRKCYRVLLNSMTYTEARELCTANGLRPADILNAEHQSLVVDYVRKLISRHVDIWLGMSYKAGTLRFYNGNDATGDAAASIRWWSACCPRSTSSYEAVGMGVSTTNFGLYNNSPMYSNTYGVLCEK